MMSKVSRFRLGYRLVLAIIAWMGIATAIISHPPDQTHLQALLDSLCFFTIQSNILVAAWLTFAVIYHKNTDTRPFLQSKIRGALTVYITVTWLVYMIILAPLWEPKGLDLFSTTVTHYITPLAFILDWLIFEQKHTYQWIYAPQWLIYPIVYLVFSQIEGPLTGTYLYPFIDTPEIGWVGLAQNVAGLVLFFFILSSIYIGINKLWQTNPTKQRTS